MIKPGGVSIWWCTDGSPALVAGDHLQAGGVAQKLVQRAHDAAELGPEVALLHPALQHQLVQHHGAVHGRGQPVVLLHRRHHLGGRTSLHRLVGEEGALIGRVLFNVYRTAFIMHIFFKNHIKERKYKVYKRICMN